MRDAHFCGTHKPEYVDAYEALETMTAKVRKLYPGALPDWSLGSCTWTTKPPDFPDGFIVAEAWIHRTKLGWWLRIKKERQ